MASSPTLPQGMPTPQKAKSSPPLQFASVFIQNETKNPNLRYRNRSQEPAVPGGKLNQTNIVYTPDNKYWKEDYNNNSHHDSGIESSFYATPGYDDSKRKLEYDFVDDIGENFESPLDYLQRKFYGRSASLFHSESASVKPQHFLPIIIVTVILASSIFTYFTFRSAIGRQYSENGNIIPSNGKYQSMEYAIKTWIQKLEASGKPLPFDIKDEDGQVLMGKKASIGYAHEVKKRSEKASIESGDMKPETGTVDDLATQSPETTEENDQSESVMPTQEEKIKRKLLLDKLSESGNLASKPVSKQAETEMEDEANVEPIEKVVGPETKNETLKSLKLKIPAQSPNSLPFSRGNVGFRANEEDDPFRFA